MEAITRGHAGAFELRSAERAFSAGAVILAIGRRGSPRKLGVPGEELEKVAYRLIDAESIQNSHVLVVGGGDSAVEAAIALARQRGNKVTLSYRKEEFVRLKEKNFERITELMKKKEVSVEFGSEVTEIRPAEAALRCVSGEKTLKNDLVFVFAGGELPAEFLQRIGVTFRTEEMLTPSSAA